MPPMETPITAGLIVDSVTVRLHLDPYQIVHAVTDASLTVPNGSVHALIGESGCGKSMLASAIMGILPPSAVVTGSVRLGADALTGSWFRGRTVGFVPQSAATFLNPVRTIGAQLRETLRYLDGTASPTELMDRVRLDPIVLQHFPHEISGGMAQRVAVAFALAGQPTVLVGDEPTASLDADLADTVFDLFREFATDGGAVLLITHDISGVIRNDAADDISVMYASRIVETGPASAVLNAPHDEYTQDLLDALPSRGLHPMPGMPPRLTNLDPHYSYADRKNGETR